MLYTNKPKIWNKWLRYKLRLFVLDDEDKTAPTANEAALVEESGCDEIGDKKDSKLSTDHA
jgi:hypothetical protein